MRAPSARAFPIASRHSAIVVTTFTLVAVLGIRVRAGPHLVAVPLNCLAHGSGKVSVFLEELRLEAVIQAEEVGQYQYLPIAMGSRADSNRRNADRLGDALREIRRDQLE